MIRKIQPIIFTGCARSGTSLAAGAINQCGAFGGNMSGPNRNNQKGMFENGTIRNDIVKPFLESIGADRKGQYPLPDPMKIALPQDWKSRVEKVIVEQGYKSGPWMYKGAKACLMWPVWNFAFPNAKWIIVRRKKEDIIYSCTRTGFMSAFNKASNQLAVGAKNEAEGWDWWVDQHLLRFREMIEAGLNIKYIWPEKMVKGDYSELMDAIDWLGLDWDSKVLSFIDPKLWKARR